MRTKQERLRVAPAGAIVEAGFAEVSMCGRARLESDYSELKIQFHIPDESPAINYPPNWNLCPTQRTPVIRLEGGRRMAELAK